jgi:hypothetical protein
MNRKYTAAIVAIMMLICIGCALNSTALKPQQELLTRFETFYMGQYNDYTVQVAQPNLSEAQKSVLREKRKVLVEAQPLITAYGSIVMQGGTPTMAQEQAIIALLNRIGGGF